MDYDSVTFPKPVRFNSKNPKVVEGILVDEKIVDAICYLMENQPTDEDPTTQQDLRQFCRNMYAKLHFTEAEYDGILRVFAVQRKKDEQ